MVTLEPPSSLTLMFFSSSYFSSFSSSSTYSFTIIFSFSTSPLLLFFLLTTQFHDLHEYWTTLHYNGTLDSHSLPLARGAKTHWNYQSINCSIENQSTILCWPENYKSMKYDRNIIMIFIMIMIIVTTITHWGLWWSFTHSQRRSTPVAFPLAAAWISRRTGESWNGICATMFIISSQNLTTHLAV